jgi:hypothetical protein
MAENFNIISYNDETGLVGNTNTPEPVILAIDSSDGGSTANGVTLLTQPTFEGYTLRVSSNETNATIFVNGVNTQKTTPQNITLTNTQLLTGNVEVTLQKEGFSTFEKYVLSLSLPENSVVINNSRFNQPLGISTSTLNIKYFINNVEQTIPSSKQLNLINGNFVFLDFNLNKSRVTPTDSALLSLDIFLGGVTNSVIVNKNGQLDLYPSLGVTNYFDQTNTLFSIKSSDINLYRITEIIVEENGASENTNTLTAEPDESLTLNLNLNKNYVLKIQTEQLSQQLPALDPRISLVNSDSRTYNINSKAGVPLVIRKNSDVKAITVIVGENVYEFDSLDEGDVAGVTIPHNAFKGLGQYSIKLYPFSLKDYETQVRPTVPPLVVKQNIKNIKTPKTEVSEIVELPTPKSFITPYELPILNVIPATPIIPTTPQIRSTQPIVRGGGGGIVTVDRDFGSGLGVERVVDRTLLRNENIQ